MLSHHASRVGQLVSSSPSSRMLLLPRAVAIELAGAVLSRNTCQLQHHSHRCYSNSASSKQWSTVPNRKIVAPGTNLRQRRPIVNGETVPFHINDIIRGSRSNLGPSSVSLSSSPFPALSPRRLPSAHPRANPLFVGANEDGGASSTASRYDSDLIVILDLDECLVHSQFSSSQNAQVFAHQLLQQRRLNQTSARTQWVDTLRFALPDGDLVHVNLRPGLRDFLKAVTERFETHIFTAAVDVYASPLLDLLDPQGSLAGRWYREHCVFDRTKRAFVKDLDRLPVSSSLDRVVLVDNNPLSFLANPSNGILVSSFYNDPEDQSLQSVWQLLQELDAHPDVRPHLDQRFGLKTALSQIPNAAGHAGATSNQLLRW